MKPVLVSLGLYRTTGGPVKTITKFKEALNGNLFCFVDPRQYSAGSFGIDDARIVCGRNLPGLRQMCYPSRAELAEVESAVKSASIVSAHSFYRFHSLWVHRMHRRLGVPYWHVPHGILDPYVLSYGSMAKRAFLRMGGRAFIEDASCIIFATRREWEKAETMLGPLHGEVVHWPVDLPDLSERIARRRRIREQLKIAEDARVLLYFGRVHGMKRPMETIDAVASLKSDKLHLLMVEIGRAHV